MLPSALLLRHAALDAIGGWDTRRIMTEDRDLAIRLAVAGRHVGFLPEPLTRLRRFDHGNLTSRKWRTMQADLAVVAKHRMLYRETLGLGLKFNYNKQYVFDLNYVQYSNNTFVPLFDRDYYSASFSVTF